MISIIAAIGKNNEIGKKNELLWNLPGDMKHFKETTAGHTVIMGQKTFESIGRPLPNRRNIVLTLDKNFKTTGVEIVYSLKELDELLKKTSTSKEENFVIGGGQIYKLFIDKADKLYITHVDASFPDADTFFPEIIPILFLENSREEHKKDKKNAYDYAFVTYDRF
ncbi:MAG: dihydrofolate reductase [Candidatus Nomurabacteria bacterium GW2011_GWE1_32_28]|uniref:Dihydrofolate reductase n=1 Tax=Candidatus Nomurabacteria bacterium GW2011_GWF1_31_48 TaxID=1618767 RepID=A0A0F9YF65_9BACT|nr:MAG: dihydrofolate reductase [Candidatus Nomurabacteria bacterium GW2011_GWF2_30_133]KKP28732.1 MAG: dihydrofolate reductase [Candidatus Nomurabacteria bacterium GW2011_GWE2_31_40]KKP30309.1 MAG: dihydrofolate reductase [Candidatus Nomurabacteria bacterium GW2011_GWF1_31_48]KKP34836.1 MAG: dihydrofolate reductase [Candidatus Nomurabacteria bacterium GW2011_GWE1_32_28]HAS80706.1 dihydrofolate reductase [Candidatus Nomurabacteria bacterium]